MLLQKEETIRALEAKKIEQDEELVQLRAELQYEELARQDLEKVRIEMAGRQSVADAEKQAADSKIEQLKRKCLQSGSMQKALQQAVDAETAALEADRAKFVALACELEQERRKLQQELATGQTWDRRVIITVSRDRAFLDAVCKLSGTILHR